MTNWNSQEIEYSRKAQRDALNRLRASDCSKGTPYINPEEARYESWNRDGFQGLFTTVELAMRTAHERIGKTSLDYWVVDRLTNRTIRPEDVAPFPRHISNSY